MNAKVWVLGDAVVDLLPRAKPPAAAPAAPQLTWRSVSPALAATADLSAASATIRLAALCAISCNRSRSTSAICASTASTVPPPWWSTWTIGGTYLYLYGAPSADLFLAEEDLPQFTANQWLQSAPSRSAPSPAAAPPSRRWKHQTCRRPGQLDPNIRPDLWQDRELLHACLDRALRMANVVSCRKRAGIHQRQ